ncbi:glycosyltransferase [Roseomonas eburnea]|uniref:Glycosyltransferase n=1 Tax=Neoroseomonas eburnea TaxID=1346889 RepID=A0A9X9XFA5_9PROT|nr:glycosyltransferase [Neoroseomonas eburnea]MBR0682391.1 glycosyltransferase [Neoroseomonas eburnea]
MARLPPGTTLRLPGQVPPGGSAAGSPEGLFATATAAADAGLGAEAAALSLAALEAAPEDPVLRLRVAMLHARLRRPATALRVAMPAFAAARGDARLADLLGMAGEALRQRGAVEEAVAMLRAAWRGSPRPAMRRALLEAGLPAYRRSLNAGADTALLEELVAAAAAATRDMPSALLAELARLIEDAGRDDLLRRLGAAALGAGDGAAARALAGIDAAAANAAGLALLATGRPGRAGIAFALAHAEAPEDPAARFNAGFAALAAGDARAAADLLAPLPACGDEAMAGAAWPRFGELPWPFARPPEVAREALAALLPEGARWPRIRLVTPCYNPGPWLEETILSVAAQGYPAVEHVVVDACSTDGTAEVLARYRPLLHGAIVGKDSGPAEAIGKGFAGSDADLFGWINADDLLAPGALHRLGAAWARDPQADIVHGFSLPHRRRRILGVQRPLAAGPEDFTVAAMGDIFGRWAEGAFFLQPEALFTRRLWERIGGALDTSLAAVFDYEMWLRAAALRPRIAQVPWPVAMYRIHAAQRTAARIALAEEQVKVRGRAVTPALPPERDAALRARLRRALAPEGRRPRLLLLDPWCAETMSLAARQEARTVLAAQGVALEIRAEPPEAAPEADLILRMLRAHDGTDWVVPLRAAGFSGPVVGWLTEDDRDPYANAAMARGLDVVIPARPGRREVLLQEVSLVLDALPPPCGPIPQAEAGAMVAAPRLQEALRRLRRAAGLG